MNHPRFTFVKVRDLQLNRISQLSVWASHGAARAASLFPTESNSAAGGPEGQEGGEGRFTGWRGGAVTVAAWIPLPPPTRHAADARGRCHRASMLASFRPPVRSRPPLPPRPCSLSLSPIACARASRSVREWAEQGRRGRVVLEAGGVDGGASSLPPKPIPLCEVPRHGAPNLKCT